MIETKITDLLGIKYPIIQAAMGWVTSAEMVAAVSNAGGLGTLAANAGAQTITKDVQETGERFRTQIRKTKELTDKPFAVNIIVPSDEGEKQFSNACLNTVIEEQVPVAIVSQGTPNMYTQTLKNAGIKVLHVVATPKHAKKAEDAGVDAIITSGSEGGGHSGFDQLTTFILVPSMTDTVKIPVIAGGGIADGRGFIAALALGAEGIYMGTRFILTRECPIHDNWKKALLNMSVSDTVVIKHGVYPFEKASDVLIEMPRGALRMALNDFTRQVIKMQSAHASQEEILGLMYSTVPGTDMSRGMASTVYGDTINGGIGAGQDIGIINDIPACGELVKRIMNEAEEVLARVNKRLPSI